MRAFCCLCFCVNLVFLASSHAMAGALQFSFSGKTASSINVACATGDENLSATASFVSLVGVNNTTGEATSTAIVQRADSTKAGAGTLFSPNVNVQTGSGWQGTFSCTPNQALFISSLEFEVFSFNATGIWQEDNRLVQYRVNILSADGSSLLAEHDSIWQTEVSVPPGGTAKICKVDFSRRVLLPPNTPFKISIALKRGSQTNGSFFGLKSISIAAEQEEVEMVAINFLGARTNDDADRGLGLPVHDFTTQELGLFPLSAEKWNDVGCLRF